MEARKVGVSPSAIQQIKINQDPYPAEFQRPGRGRIEVVTKAGSEAYHGSADFTFRDARLNARDAFAPTLPAEQRRIFEGVLGGPVWRREAQLVPDDTRTSRRGRAGDCLCRRAVGGKSMKWCPTPDRAGLEFSASWTHPGG